jgi:glycosyltransferase involved in cell wall biosynthesis
VALAADAAAHADHMVVASAGGDWVADLEATGARHAAIPGIERGAVRTLEAARRLRQLVRSLDPDVVHTHNVGVTVAARLGLGLSRRPLITTLHGLDPGDYRRAAMLLRCSRTTLVACAPAVGRAAARAGYPPGRLRVITNGARLEPAGPHRIERLRRSLELDVDPPLVVGVGRLVPQKDWGTLVRAVQGRGDLQVVVAGAGPEQAELSKLAAARAAPIRFVGAVDDMAALLGAARCVVATSTWEGLPLSLLEALSLGKPAVATAVDGVTDVVPADAAVLVPPRRPDLVAEGIQRVLRDPALAERLSTTARIAAAAWSPERMTDAYRQLYLETVATR